MVRASGHRDLGSGSMRVVDLMKWLRVQGLGAS